MKRRGMLIGSVVALVAPVLPAWALPQRVRLLVKPEPRLALAGVAPRFPDRNSVWVKDCLVWRGRVLTGARAHWCWDWHGVPVDETTPEHEYCTCEWQHPEPGYTVVQQRQETTQG